MTRVLRYLVSQGTGYSVHYVEGPARRWVLVTLMISGDEVGFVFAAFRAGDIVYWFSACLLGLIFEYCAAWECHLAWGPHAWVLAQLNI